MVMMITEEVAMETSVMYHTDQANKRPKPRRLERFGLEHFRDLKYESTCGTEGLDLWFCET